MWHRRRTKKSGKRDRRARRRCAVNQFKGIAAQFCIHLLAACVPLPRVPDHHKSRTPSGNARPSDNRYEYSCAAKKKKAQKGPGLFPRAGLALNLSGTEYDQRILILDVLVCNTGKTVRSLGPGHVPVRNRRRLRKMLRIRPCQILFARTSPFTLKSGLPCSSLTAASTTTALS